MNDIEALCDRVVIIDQGAIIYDGSVEKLRMAEREKTIEVELRLGNRDERNRARVISLISEYSEEPLSASSRRFRLRVPQERSLDVISELLSLETVQDLNVQPPRLDSIIRRIYEGGPVAVDLVRKHARLLVRYWIITFKELTAFTWDVWLSVIQFVLYISRSLVFWWAVSSAAGAFGGWTKPELALFTVVFYLPGLHWLFWNFWNCGSFSDKVLRGDLDKYLARPVHPLFALAVEDVHLAMFLKYFIPPLAMAVVFVRAYGLPVTFLRFVGGYLLLSAGKLVLTMMLATTSMVAFKHGDVSGLQSLLFQFTALGSYPVTAFPQALQFFLGYVLPAAFTATYPTLFMLGKADGLRVFGIAVGLCAAWAAILLRAWSVTVREYESPGG